MLAFFKIHLDPGAKLPTRAHDSDVGYDITAKSVSLTKDHKIIIDTGIHIQPQQGSGFYAEVVPNSRISKTPFTYANTPGIIDPDYTGTIKIILNIAPHATDADIATIRPGATVGQLIIRHRHSALWEIVDSLTPTQRADGGFGSTEK